MIAIPVERINTRADQISFAAAFSRLLALLLSLVAAPLIALGWGAFFVWQALRATGRGVKRSAKWVAAAVMLGWESAKERRAR